MSVEYYFFVCRMEGTLSPLKKLPPESTPRVMFTGFEPSQVQHYTKVISPICVEPFLCISFLDNFLF